MEIRKVKSMLLYLAIASLTFSSCQKEEELLIENGAPPAAQPNQNADEEVCGAIVNSDSSALHRMEQTESIVQAYIAANPGITSGSARTLVTIPVVFHVVYNTAEQNISSAQIQSQVDALNEDFNAANIDLGNVPSAFQSFIGNSGIHFALAARDPNGNAITGITRTFTSTTSFSNDGSVCFTSMGGHNAWPSNQYLNIWICNKSGGAGYSTYPWSGSPTTDGIIVRYNYVGRVGPFINNWNYQKGRTLTHEVGHWLGLIHLWGDAACGNDLVGDTPQQSGANSSCPTFPDMSSCSPNASGDMYMNYMDYTNDNCRTMFSVMQVTRMLGYLNTTRASILTSLGAVAPSSSTSVCNVPGGLSATSISSSSASLSWASTGATSYSIKYKPLASTAWTTASAAATSYSVSGLNASTSYEFQVQSICSSGSSAFSSSATFTTQAPALVCNVPTGLVASSITATGATLSWASTGALSYNVRYKPSVSSTWITVSSASVFKTISGLAASTAYQFQVQSVCSSGLSAYSSTATFTTSASSTPVCNVPGGLFASSITSNSATLSWTSTGAASYNISYKLYNSQTWITVSSASASTVITGLMSNKTYQFRVQSVCLSGSSAYSAYSTFTTLKKGNSF